MPLFRTGQWENSIGNEWERKRGEEWSKDLGPESNLG